MDPNYFEGKLQLRNCSEDVYRVVYKLFKARKNVHIAKEEALKTGTDMYVSDNRFLQSVGKQLKKRFKGQLKTSRKLHSVHRLTSKKLYRVTVLFRMD